MLANQNALFDTSTEPSTLCQPYGTPVHNSQSKARNKSDMVLTNKKAPNMILTNKKVPNMILTNKKAPNILYPIKSLHWSRKRYNWLK